MCVCLCVIADTLPSPAMVKPALSTTSKPVHCSPPILIPDPVSRFLVSCFRSRLSSATFSAPCYVEAPCLLCTSTSSISMERDQLTAWLPFVAPLRTGMGTVRHHRASHWVLQKNMRRTFLVSSRTRDRRWPVHKSACHLTDYHVFCSPATTKAQNC
jgi:hypothetical protein